MTQTIGVHIPGRTPALPPPATNEIPAFRLIQPRNLASWFFVIAICIGALQTYRYFRPALDAIELATVLGFGIFALYAVPWIAFLRWIDHWTRIPGRLAVSAFLWGGFAATFFVAIPGNGALSDIYAKSVSAIFAEEWGAALSAPFSEEIGKGVGVLLLMAIASRVFRTPFDGFVVGGFVGLGFQILEDVLYVVNSALQSFGGDEIATVIQITVVRGLTGLISHTFYTAIVGTGLVFLIGTTRTAPRRALGLSLMLLSMLIHGMWDAMGPIGEVVGLPSVVVMLVVSVIGLASVVTTFRLAASRERDWTRELMAPEAERGIITPEELTVITGSRKDRRRYLKAARHTGRGARSATRHLLDAASELATALSASAGQDTPSVIRCREEVARLRASAKGSAT
jgi:RsiW-degrading membrane proteinase PrsW (M82 family)